MQNALNQWPLTNFFIFYAEFFFRKTKIFMLKDSSHRIRCCNLDRINFSFKLRHYYFEI